MQEKWTVVDCIKDIPNIYWVSTWGRVINAVTGNHLPKYYEDLEENRYVTVRIACGKRNSGVTIELHRLVLMEFNPHPLQDQLEVDHIDGIKCHNWLWNLEWVTHEENMRRAKEKELFVIGEDRKLSKVSNAQIEQLCGYIEKGLNSKQVQSIMHIDDVNIEKLYYNVKCGHCWKHISEKYDFAKRWLC